ncbi:hypothetical protein BJ546DRAFT_103026 [Cryomyces antarcticus]
MPCKRKTAANLCQRRVLGARASPVKAASGLLPSLDGGRSVRVLSSKRHCIVSTRSAADRSEIGSMAGALAQSVRKERDEKKLVRFVGASPITHTVRKRKRKAEADEMLSVLSREHMHEVVSPNYLSWEIEEDEGVDRETLLAAPRLWVQGSLQSHAASTF